MLSESGRQRLLAEVGNAPLLLVGTRGVETVELTLPVQDSSHCFGRRALRTSHRIAVTLLDRAPSHVEAFVFCEDGQNFFFDDRTRHCCVRPGEFWWLGSEPAKLFFRWRIA